MILALSSGSRILIGISVLGIGLLLVASYIAMDYLKRERNARESARIASLQVSEALSRQPVEPTMETLFAQSQAMIGELRSGGSREDFKQRLSRASKLLEAMQERIRVLTKAHETVLDLSVEELAHVLVEDELGFARLVTFFDAAEHLEQEVTDTRRSWSL